MGLTINRQMVKTVTANRQNGNFNRQLNQAQLAPREISRQRS